MENRLDFLNSFHNRSNPLFLFTKFSFFSWNLHQFWMTNSKEQNLFLFVRKGTFFKNLIQKSGILLKRNCLRGLNVLRGQLIGSNRVNQHWKSDQNFQKFLKCLIALTKKKVNTTKCVSHWSNKNRSECPSIIHAVWGTGWFYPLYLYFVHLFKPINWNKIT